MGMYWTGIVIILGLLGLLCGGRGKIYDLMGDMAKGMTAFRKGLRDDDEDKPDGAAKALNAGAAEQTSTEREDKRSGS